jgi:hypothetical protein
MIKDRADGMTTRVFQITALSSICEAERRAQVRDLIRDELQDLRREVAADLRIDPDA